MVAVTSSDPNLYNTAAGAFLGVILTPDLDQNGETIGDWFIFTFPAIGASLRRFYMAYSWMYRKLFKHRSFWSHTPVIGTVIRLAYFFWWVYALGWSLPPSFINGIVAVDAIHWMLDFRMFRKVVS